MKHRKSLKNTEKVKKDFTTETQSPQRKIGKRYKGIRDKAVRHGGGKKGVTLS